MNIRSAISQNECRGMTTADLRKSFLIEKLSSPGSIQMVYWETDRTVIGMAVPKETSLLLGNDPVLGAEFFCERRELGVLNIGGAGRVEVDGCVHALESLDALYVGRGSQKISFESLDSDKPAKFYIVSYPSHVAFPSKLVRHSEARRVSLGNKETANLRTIFQYIHEESIQSSQLVMGFTRLEPGSVWNTMPPHTHLRRSEVYFYFDVVDSAAVFHFMGAGDETRHLLLHSEEAVLSPPWSIHSGCGTQAYSFIWAMGGENKKFTDMQGIEIRDLR